MKRSKSLTGRHLRSLRPKLSGKQIIVYLANVGDDVIGIDPYKHSMIRLRDDHYTGNHISHMGGSTSWQAGMLPDAESAPTQEEKLFDVLSGMRSTETSAEDPAFPDAIAITGTPQLHGFLAARFARTLLKEVATPLSKNLLGVPGWSAPYWDFNGQYPSVALIKKVDHILLFLRDDGSSWARLTSRTVDTIMPVSSRDLQRSLSMSKSGTLQAKELEEAIGFRPYCLLVALDAPHDGHCYKTLATLIPRP